MTKRQAIEATRQRCVERNMARTTENTYAYWVGQYCDWKKTRSAEDGLQEWLTHLAAVQKVAVKTQQQALNALVFFYKRVLGREVGKLDFRPARQSRKVPDFLTHAECIQLFGQMRGLPQLQAQVMYGTGLRVSEMLALRIKDLDFGSGTITVRDGKGAKDRVVPMPKALADQLSEQCEKARYWHGVDRAVGHPAPYLPDSSAKKLGKQITTFAWFWIFPATNLSTDPRSKIVRRHHVTDRGVAKALKIAAQRAGIQKRVTPHVMRHSFATEMIRGGLDIKSLSVLMGHASTATTEIYLHCLPHISLRAVSPLDSAHADSSATILPFRAA